MKKKKITVVLALMILLGILSIGIWKWQDNEDEAEAPYQLYYVNSEITALNTAPYKGEIMDTEVAVTEMLKGLKTQNDIEMLPAIPENVEVVSYSIEHEKLNLHFNQAYYAMDPAREVMCRAAVVCSLTQVNGINEVMFYVEEEPLKDKDGDSYGYMQEEEFVQNTGSSINSYEMTDFVLYFSDAEGNCLVPESVSMRCNSSQARERAVVERLLKGPVSHELRATVHPDTKLLNVSMNEGICYLNFNEGLNKSMPGLRPEIIIYSIVNTVIECGNVGMVQIAINGESDLMFQESVKLGEPLSRNLDIMEERPSVETKTDEP